METEPDVSKFIWISNSSTKDAFFFWNWEGKRTHRFFSYFDIILNQSSWLFKCTLFQTFPSSRLWAAEKFYKNIQSDFLWVARKSNPRLIGSKYYLVWLLSALLSSHFNLLTLPVCQFFSDTQLAVNCESLTAMLFTWIVLKKIAIARILVGKTFAAVLNRKWAKPNEAQHASHCFNPKILQNNLQTTRLN